MNPDLLSLLKKQILPGERLIWRGMPKQGVVLRKADWFMIPFSLLWGGFAIVWETLVLTYDAPLLFAIFGIPFVLAAIYLIFGRFYFEAVKRKHTIYGLTDRRILIIKGIRKKHLLSRELSELPEPRLKERFDRSGSITFGSYFDFAKNLNNIQNRQKYPPEFDMIREADSVYKMIGSLQREAKQEAAASKRGWNDRVIEV